MLRTGIRALEACGRWRVARRCIPPCTKREQVSTMSTCMYACADLCGCARASALPTHRSLAQAPQHPPPSEDSLFSLPPKQKFKSKGVLLHSRAAQQRLAEQRAAGAIDSTVCKHQRPGGGLARVAVSGQGACDAFLQCTVGRRAPSPRCAAGAGRQRGASGREHFARGAVDRNAAGGCKYRVLRRRRAVAARRA